MQKHLRVIAFCCTRQAEPLISTVQTGQTDTQTDGRYQLYYLPALRLINMAWALCMFMKLLKVFTISKAWYMEVIIKTTSPELVQFIAMAKDL